MSQSCKFEDFGTNKYFSVVPDQAYVVCVLKLNPRIYLWQQCFVLYVTIYRKIEDLWTRGLVLSFQ